MSSSDSRETMYRVVCVCGGYGFPLGTGSAARIMMMGKAVQEGGIGFHVLHCGPSPVAINTQKSGIYESVSFQYTNSVRRPENRVVRFLLYVRALVTLTFHLAKLWPVRRSTVIYLYVMDGPLNPYAGCLCRLLGLPVAQELCEWFPGEPSSSAFTRWLYRKWIFNIATGALVISNAIEKRVTALSAKVNACLIIHRVPVIVDANRFADADSAMDGLDQEGPNFVYCGTWLRDVFPLIGALALTKLEGHECRLTIVGEYREADSLAILDYAKQRGLSPRDIILRGCIAGRALETCYKTATALLMPLPSDDRSITRLPNKMGEYLASGRPVISCKIGDLTDFLIDNVNAYLAKPGDERDLAARMIAVLEDPDRATEIGAAGQQICFSHLDYRAHVSGLANFFVDCIEHHKGRSVRNSRRSNEQRMFEDEPKM